MRHQDRLLNAIQYLGERSLTCPVVKLYWPHIGDIPIKSFADLTETDFYLVRRILIDDHSVKLSREYPFNEEALQKIHNCLGGLYLGHSIYIRTSDSIEEVASSIIHEVDHQIKDVLNDDLSIRINQYEIEAMTAEWHFKNPYRRLTRNQSRIIQDEMNLFYGLKN